MMFLCGKMAAGKFTLARDLAKRKDAILLVQDELLENLWPGEIIDMPKFFDRSARLKECGRATYLRSSLERHFRRTRFSRQYKRRNLRGSGNYSSANVDHELHFIDASDDLCERQLKDRSKNLPPGTAWTTDAEFETVTAYFQPPSEEEGFNVICHERI